MREHTEPPCEAEQRAVASADLRPLFLDAEVSRVVFEFIYRQPKRLPPWVTAVQQSRQVTRETLDLELARWEANGFTAVERDVWLEAGLKARELLLAEAVRRQRIRPDELRRTMQGRTALEYLRSGESVAQVYARLREVG